jgi:hypothetical protein
MKNIAIYVENYTDDMLLQPTSPYNRDNCLSPYFMLQHEFEKNNAVLHTVHYYQQHRIKPDAIIYVDTLFRLPEWNDIPAYLILAESMAVKPSIWDRRSHDHYQTIFCWHEPFIDNQRYIWANIYSGITNPLQWSDVKNKKLCTLINGNKFSHHPHELYTARKKLIRWFEKNHPEDFDLFGTGWNRCQFRHWPWRILNRVPYINRLLHKKYSSYRGTVTSKFTTLNQYQFCICFENCEKIEGYITEKIWDAFTAGCIPIYWGAPNIKDYIPENCFIDYRKFTNIEALYTFLKHFSQEQYKTYRQAMHDFLVDKTPEKGKKDYFSRTVARFIC